MVFQKRPASGIGRDALEHDLGAAQRQRAVGDVVWPVTQPMSAVHQKTSSSFRSKVHLVVSAACSR
jgi:hypothetical protein